MSRRFERLAFFLSLALAAPVCMASQFTFSNGHFTLTVPDGWPRIMQSHGNPESMVFQVPDPAPADHNALARITVTSQRVRDIASFQQFVATNINHARALPQFNADKRRSGNTDLYYTANEGRMQQTYTEHYVFRDGYAIMVRCVRPSRSSAGATWTSAFDKGCASMTASVR